MQDDNQSMSDVSSLSQLMGDTDLVTKNYNEDEKFNNVSKDFIEKDYEYFFHNTLHIYEWSQFYYYLHFHLIFIPTVTHFT